MSSKKDRERAEAGEIHRDGKLVRKEKCLFPACGNNASPKSKIGLCQTCDYVIHLVGWYDQQMEARSGQNPDLPKGAVLLVPKPGMEKEAIREALAKAPRGNQP